jgi:putative transcriptional regulator
MIRSHVSDDIITGYAAGSLDEASSLLVASHLTLCPHCRLRAAQAEALGGHYLDALEETAVSPAMMADVLLHEQNLPAGGDAAVVRPDQAPSRAILPSPLRGYVGGDVDELRWKRVAPKIHQVAIPVKDTRSQARLLRFQGGMMVPSHGHNGRELTLVLSGSLCDRDTTLHRGDVAEMDERTEHQPFSGSGEDCICLAVTDAPLKFKSVLARILQPFFGI